MIYIYITIRRCLCHYFPLSIMYRRPKTPFYVIISIHKYYAQTLIIVLMHLSKICDDSTQISG